MRLLKILILLFINSNLFAQQNWTNLINDDNLNNWEIKQGSAEFELKNGIISAT